MVKKFFLPVILFVFIFLVSGCTVVRGASGGIKGLAAGAVEGGREGFKEDLEFINNADNWIKDSQGLISRADSWVKENLW